MARKKIGEEKKVAYNGRLQQYKIDALGGCKKVNALAYEYLTELYNKIKG